MDEQQLGQLDLFPTDLIPPKRGRGRPGYDKTKEKQQLVDSMLRYGLTQNEISSRLGISLSTLKRFFSTSPLWNPGGHGSRPKPKNNNGDKGND